MFNHGKLDVYTIVTALAHRLTHQYGTAVLPPPSHVVWSARTWATQKYGCDFCYERGVSTMDIWWMYGGYMVDIWWIYCEFMVNIWIIYG